MVSNYSDLRNRFEDLGTIVNSSGISRVDNSNCSEDLKKPQLQQQSAQYSNVSPLSTVSMPSPPSLSSTPDYNPQRANTNYSSASSLTSAAAVKAVEALSSDCSSNSSPSCSPSEIQQIEAMHAGLLELKQFLDLAPKQFSRTDLIQRFRLPTDEWVSCVRWNQTFCVTGTDIVRILVYRFSVFGRDVINRKKFEEGVFSDLRNLKINTDATLESPKSELLEFLYKRHCVRTKKKQKVFFWYSVNHDQLFMDALERELKKEAATLEAESTGDNGRKGSTDQEKLAQPMSVASTVALREPARSFLFDVSVSLSEQLPRSLAALPQHYAALVEDLNLSTSSESEQYYPVDGIMDTISYGGYYQQQRSMQQQDMQQLRKIHQAQQIYHEQGHYTEDYSGNAPYYGNCEQQTSSNSHKPIVDGRFGTFTMANGYQSSNNAEHPRTPQLSTEKINLESMHTKHAAYGKIKNSGTSSNLSPSSLYCTPPNGSPPQRHQRSQPQAQAQNQEQQQQQQQPSPQATPQSQPTQQQPWLREPAISYMLNLENQPEDFPLEVLKEEDKMPRTLFDTKFMDFAHHNRPALSQQNGHSLLFDGGFTTTETFLSTDKLGVAGNQINPFSASTNVQPPFRNPGQQPFLAAQYESSEWDHFMCTETPAKEPTQLGSPFQEKHGYEPKAYGPQYLSGGRVSKRSWDATQRGKFSAPGINVPFKVLDGL